LKKLLFFPVRTILYSSIPTAVRKIRQTSPIITSKKRKIKFTANTTISRKNKINTNSPAYNLLMAFSKDINEIRITKALYKKNRLISPNLKAT
jgi:hypothetical protein